MTSLIALASRVIVFTADPSAPPTPPAFTGDPDTVTPGVLGFVAIFLVTAATILLVIDMTRRIRRVRYREEIRERIAIEKAEHEFAESSDPSDPGTSGSDTPGPDTSRPDA